MTVTDVWMGTGSWSLRLKPETPGDILDALDWTKTPSAGLGHLLVFPGRVNATLLSTTDLLANAKYTGVLLEWADGYTVTGAGPGWWLGDSGDRGPLLETAVTNTAGSLGTWLASLTPSSLKTGGVAGTGTTVTATFEWVTHRRALEAICAQNAASALPGCGWWVTPDMKLNVGGPTDVYNGTPPLAIRRTGGRDATVQGLTGARIDRSMDLREYVSKVRANGPGGLGTYSAASAFLDINGNTASVIAVVDVPTCPAGAESTVAQAEYNARNATRRHVRISTDTFDLIGHEASQVRTGAYINVFDPDQGLYDQSNEVYFGGQPVWPLKLQVLGQTWPIRQGYGVWFRNGAGTLTDLTDWFVPETGAASIDVGAMPRTPSNPAGIAGLVEIGQVGFASENGAWVDWTPQVDQGVSTNISKTINYARYRRDGSRFKADFDLSMTGAGTAGSTITVSIPFDFATTAGGAKGAGQVYDASANQRYVCCIERGGTSKVGFAADGAYNNQVGATPSFAIASGDVLRASIDCEIAI